MDGAPITVGHLREAMLRRGGAIPGVFASEENKQALLEELIGFEVMKARARAAGYYERPDVRASIDKVVVSRFHQDALQGRAAETEVSDGDMEAYYRERPEEFKTPAEVRAALVYIAAPASMAPDERARLEAKADAVRQEVLGLDAGAPHLGDIAVKNSDDQATRYRGGDIGWLVRDRAAYRWDPAVLAAICRLERVGDVAPVIATDSGFYVARLTGRRDSTVRPLDEVRGAVRARLVAERKLAAEEALQAEMRKGLQISIDEKRLASVQPPESARIAGVAKKPPAFPEGVN